MPSKKTLITVVAVVVALEFIMNKNFFGIGTMLGRR